MAIQLDMTKEEFLKQYGEYVIDSMAESERHLKELHRISDKYEDFLDTLYEKIFLKLDSSIEKDVEEIENWLNDTVENRPESIVEDPSGKKLVFVNRDSDEYVPDNLYLLKAICEDSVEISFEPVNKELVKSNMYFTDSKQLDERFFKVSDLAAIEFPDDYLEAKEDVGED